MTEWPGGGSLRKHVGLLGHPQKGRMTVHAGHPTKGKGW
jgi:hypothetical protein